MDATRLRTMRTTMPLRNGYASVGKKNGFAPDPDLLLFRIILTTTTFARAQTRLKKLGKSSS
jgi:hypothetical protein